MPQNAPFATGAVLNERYRIVKLLGQGGFGAVYRAWDLNLQMPCALKENFDSSPESVRQFYREAVILANLRHVNLPAVSDHFSTSEQVQCLVMEFVEGQDMQHLIQQAGGALSVGQALPIISQVCDALAYLHSQSPPVIHRDIKPANIKITSQGQVKLVDFGIAKVYDPSGRTTLGARAVTPGFSPPEQYGRGTTDTRSDIYALGATLYMALTGQSPLESIARQMGSPLAAPRTLKPTIPANIENAILKALAISPSQRFQSVAELMLALEMPAPTGIAAKLSPTLVYPQVAQQDQPYTPVGSYPIVGGKPPVAIPISFPDQEAPLAASPPVKRTRKFLLAAAIVISLLFLALIGYWGFLQLPTASEATATREAVVQASVTLSPSLTPSLTPTLFKTPTISNTATALPTETAAPTPTLVPTLTSTLTSQPPTYTVTSPGPWLACPNTYLSRLHVGDRAYLSFDPPYPNIVRSQPTRSAKELGKIYPGEEVEILDGPQCANKMVWWLVRSLKTGLTGWTSEGDSEKYWLVPMD